MTSHDAVACDLLCMLTCAILMPPSHCFNRRTAGALQTCNTLVASAATAGTGGIRSASPLVSPRSQRGSTIGPSSLAGRNPLPLATENLLENTDGVLDQCSLGGGTLLPSIYADACDVDAVVVSKACTLRRACPRARMAGERGSSRAASVTSRKMRKRLRIGAWIT